MTIFPKPVVLAAAIAAALLPIIAGAQAAAPSGTPDQSADAQNSTSKKKTDQTQEMAGITVTGIAKSLEAGLDTKRNADSFVDAINAEDVGKLPDANIAEVLQRVPGVTIQRTDGEGDFVSIRGLGPNFVRGEVDGRTIISGTETHEEIRNGGVDTSTGRATNFDVLPSEIVQKIEVYKSPTAAMIEGGIGGVVNVVTQDPLDLGNRYSLSANYQYREFNKTTDPDVSALASWRNADKTFAILGNIAYSSRTIRVDDMDSYGWATPTNWAPVPNIDSTGSGTPNLNGYSSPWTVNARETDQTRVRTTAQVKAAWRFADDSELMANALYSRRKDDTLMLNSTFGVAPGTGAVANNLAGTGITPQPGWNEYGGAGNCGLGVVAGGFCTIPGAKGSNGALTSFAVNSGITDIYQQYFQTDSLSQFGLNYRKDLGSLHLNGDLSYSRGNGTLNFLGDNVELAYVLPFQYLNDGKRLQIQPIGNQEFSSPGD